MCQYWTAWFISKIDQKLIIQRHAQTVEASPLLNKLRADKEKYHITTALVKDWPPVHVVVLE